MTKRILVTNDDGIQAEGIKRLEEAMLPLGEVTVVAPEREMSATSQSLSLNSPLRVHRVDAHHFSVAGTPADAVILAIHHLLAERPDLVVSGINPGGNLGENIVYSGTVAAAMEATLHGVPAIAVSLASRKQLDFSRAADFAQRLATKVLNDGLPAGVMLNVNVPRGEVKGVRITRMSRKISQNVIHEQKDPRGRPYYWHDETLDLGQVEPDSDYAAIVAHEISVTPLQVDRTDYSSLNHLSAWLPSLKL
jgi:5'-nucleotidase